MQSLGSFTLKFREAVRDGIIGDRAKTILGNIEDARSNCFQVSHVEDELQRKTVRFIPADAAYDNADDEDENEQSGVDLEGPELDELLHLFDVEEDASSQRNASTSPTDESTIPQSFKLDMLHQKGVLKCGYDNLAGMKMHAADRSKVYEAQQVQPVETGGGAEDNSTSDINVVRQTSPEQ